MLLVLLKLIPKLSYLLNYMSNIFPYMGCFWVFVFVLFIYLSIPEPNKTLLITTALIPLSSSYKIFEKYRSVERTVFSVSIHIFCFLPSTPLIPSPHLHHFSHTCLTVVQMCCVCSCIRDPVFAALSVGNTLHPGDSTWHTPLLLFVIYSNVIFSTRPLPATPSKTVISLTI